MKVLEVFCDCCVALMLGLLFGFALAPLWYQIGAWVR